MRIIGYFNNINNDKTYWMQIGETGDVKYIQDSLDDLNEQAICWGTTPITISSDISDTFENVFIRSCEINLVTNFDVRPYIIANNIYDLPIEIRYDDENGDIIFSGYVSPLSFNQSFAQEWNEFTVNCVDKLGLLEYIKFKPYISSPDYATPRTFIDMIIGLNTDINIKPVNFSAKIYNIDYDHTQDTKINPYIFIGDSQDDWMTCKEVLEEIGKIYGCYFYQNGDTCVIENIMLYDLNSPVTITEDDYSSNDTNITIQEAYNRIECTVDLSTLDETFIDPFSEDVLIPTTDKAERVLTEIKHTNTKNNSDCLYDFRHTCDTAQSLVDWSLFEYTSKTSDNIEIYDDYCSVLKNSMFTFTSPNYLVDGEGEGTKDVYKTLRWLWNNPGKGAFLSFGRTENIFDKKNKQQVQINDMKNYLLIQVNSDRTESDYKEAGSWSFDKIYNKLGQQIQDNWPICEFTLPNAVNLVPNDISTTNYLVIDGKITLNPITPKTGPHGDFAWGAVNGQSGMWNTYYRSATNNILGCMNTWTQYWPNNWLVAPIADNVLKGRTVKKEQNDNGFYFQYYGYDNINNNNPWPYNQTPNFVQNLAIPYLKTDYKRLEYKASSYQPDGSKVEIDNINKLAILACELKIGDKYLVENLDMLNSTNWSVPWLQYSQIYKWLTYDECPERDGVKQTWFTIGINPGVGDFLLGQEYSIQNTVDIRMNIKATGLALPISYNDKLSGQVSFKILGPYNVIYSGATCYLPFWWASSYTTGHKDYPLLVYIENIIISDLKMNLYSNNGGVSDKKSKDNDLVYYSYENNQYLETKDYDCKFCTSLTSEEVNELGIEYNLNNSSILGINNLPWYGMTYKGVNNVKLEEARVSEHYNIWKRPRSIVKTTIKLDEPDLAYLKTNYIFNFLKYNNNTPHIYKALARELDLKFDTMECTMKELSEEPLS